MKPFINNYDDIMELLDNQSDSKSNKQSYHKSKW